MAEMYRYNELLVLQHRGLVRGLKRQVPFILYAGETPIKITSNRYPNGRVCKYTMDFVYEELEVTSHGLPSTWTLIYEEYKGVDSDIARFRRATFETCYATKIRVTGPAVNPRRKPAKVSS